MHSTAKLRTRKRAGSKMGLAQLERAGVIRRGSGKAARQIQKERPLKLHKGLSVLEALLAERAKGK